MKTSARITGAYLLLRRTTILTALLTVSLFNRISAQSAYLSKTSVDTSIQNAFYAFNEAMSLTAGQESRMRDAIAHAKEVVSRLKDKARGDPNEKYILWKVSELEQQIWLEERDLVLTGMQRTQRDVNGMISRFNAEVAKARPDFSLLEQYHEQTARLDPGKGNELAASIRHRATNLVREILLHIERAWVADELDEVERELRYCYRYRQSLPLPEQRFANLYRELKTRRELVATQRSIEKELDHAETLLQRCDFGEIWTIVQRVQASLAEVDTALHPREAYGFSRRIEAIIEVVDQREDSLMQAALTILHQQGADPAIDFVEDAVRPCGVSRAKLSHIEKEILAVAPAAKSRLAETLAAELAAFTKEQTGSSSLTLEQVQLVTARRAKARADSLRALAEEEARKEAERNRILMAARMKEQQRREKKERKAREIVVEIYALLEEGNARKANRKLERAHGFLEEYSNGPVLTTLQQTVTAELEARETGAHGDETAVVMVDQTSAAEPTPASSTRSAADRAQQEVMTIYELLGQGEHDAAHQRFLAQQQLLRENIIPEAYNILQSTLRDEPLAAVMPAPDTAAGQGPPGTGQWDEQRAQQRIAHIYELLEQNRVQEAWEHFQADRSQLHPYISEDAYQYLEAAVSRAIPASSAGDPR